MALFGNFGLIGCKQEADMKNMRKGGNCCHCPFLDNTTGIVFIMI